MEQQFETETNTQEISYLSQEKQKKQKIQISYDDAEKNLEEKVNQILKRCLQIFPYPEPYPSQKDSMKNIIESLCKKNNLLFQSPTGTGKTLVTLCAALAFIEDQEDTQILLLTRTNEQINGFIKEIRKITEYEDIDSYAILTGRGQLCLKLNEALVQFKTQNQIDKSKFNKFLTKFCNEKQNKHLEQQVTQEEENKVEEIYEENNQLCNYKEISNQNYKILLPVQNKQVQINNKCFDIESDEEKKINPCGCCEHYKAHKQLLQKIDEKQIQELSYPKTSNCMKQPHTLPDIEEIRDLFQQENLGCPFYYNRIAAKKAKIIFTSYNYVIKQKILKSISGILSKKLIVIFDEAHNICEQAEQEQKIKLHPKHWEQFKQTTDEMVKIFSKQKATQSQFINQEVRNLIKRDINKESEFLKEKFLKKMKSDQSSECDSQITIEEEQTQTKYQNQKKNENQNKHKDKFFKQTQNLDLYSKALQIIQYSGDTLCDNFKFINNKSDFLKKLSTVKQYDQQETDQIFDQFIIERQIEVYYKLDNLQRDQINIDAECEGLTQQFQKDQNQNAASKPFCVLFSEKEKIEKHFKYLQIDDTEQTNEFLERILKLSNLFYYIKKIVKDQIQELKKSNKNKNKKNDQNGEITVVESNIKAYKAEDDFYRLRQLEIFEKLLQIKYFKKIWYFYYKLQNFWKEYQIDSKQRILQDHYLSLLNNYTNETSRPSFQIGSLSASYTFEKIFKKLDIYSMILTSGTLEPFELIEQSIRVPFQKYSASHIINPKTNLFTQFISSYNCQKINFSQSKMNNEIMKQKVQTKSNDAIGLIQSIFVEFTEKACKKAGIIIFFKNYHMMNDYQRQLKQLKQFNDFEIFTETKDAAEFKEMYGKYKRTIEKNKQNCLFLAVNRGKLSEGIDLKDELCRIIILLGVPYSNFTDPYVKCKKLYSKIYLQEGRWYEKETVKVINQAAGRCIRYKDDWGCIFFIDDQFENDILKKNISQWIKDGQKQNNSEDNKWINQYKQFLESQITNNQINSQ